MFKRKFMNQAISLAIAVMMTAGMMTGCSSSSSKNAVAPNTAEKAAGGVTPTAETSATGTPEATVSDIVSPITPEELGSGNKKWSEEETADGWMKVTNDGGDTLGYTKDSGISLIQVDGYAFKDLDRDGKLDGYEDWRLDNEKRAKDLAAQMTAEEMTPLFTHGGWTSFDEKLGDDDKAYIDGGARAGVTRSAATEGNTKLAVKWSNMLQKTCESTGKWGIPATVSVDPSNISGLLDQNGLGASMDTDLAKNDAKEAAKEYRAVGITMLLGPQVDIASNPQWCRASGTYSEDPALNRDMAKAYIDGLQSTYDENGNDLGWGKDSVVAIVKHYAGAGASEGGRNDHFKTGEYTVFPGNNFAAHLIPFFDGAFKLDGKTGAAGGLMPNYAVSYSEDGSLGDEVGGAYSEYKVKLLKDNGYDGFILTDWQVTDDDARDYGVEDLKVGERFCKLYENGVDQVGGTSDLKAAQEGYDLLVEDWGEDKAIARLRDAAASFFVTQMETGLFENSYLTTDEAVNAAWTDKTKAYGAETQEKGIVMIKNKDNAIHKSDASQKKPTAYIPLVFKDKADFFSQLDGKHDYKWEPAVNVDEYSKYYNIVTDTLGDPSGKKGAYTEKDVIRASAKQLAKCDYAIVKMNNPYTNSTTDKDGNYLPNSLQYAAYTADTAKETALANGKITKEVKDGYYGAKTETVEENRSYKGNTAAKATNYADLETLQYVSKTVPKNCKVVVAMKISSSADMVWSEVEPLADAIVVYYSGSMTELAQQEEAVTKVLTGQVEPTGLLTMQQPASMKAVEAQKEDVPRDTECYVDSEGNKYDFTFGMNWSGVISDDRTTKYNVAPLTTPETISFSYAK